MKAPLLNVITCTYNHENFIGQCIEGVINQKTNFPYTHIIGEDHSTDGTLGIINQYRRKFPDKIQVVSHSKNIGAHRNAIDLLSNATAKYIALCDGDDYWTDSNKLQKQFDYLEKHPKASICIHNGNVLKGSEISGPSRDSENKIYTLENVVRNRVLAPTASYMYRNIINLPGWFKDAYGGDMTLLILLAQKGEIHYLPEVMCTYRVNPDSLERRYLNRPLDKSSRDINDYKVYLRVLQGKNRLILMRKIIWNYMYRIYKGVQLKIFNTFISDLTNAGKYSVIFVSYSIRCELRKFL